MALIAQPAATEAREAAELRVHPWIVIAFLWPLTRLIDINVGGHIYGQDLIGLLFLGLAFAQGRSGAALAQIKVPLFLIAVWLSGQIFTDIYRQTPFEDYVRGWSKIFLFGVQVAALWLFIPKKTSYFLAFAFGQAVVLMLSYFSVTSEGGIAYDAADEGTFWKFGLGEGAGLFIACACSGMVPRLRGLARLAPLALAAWAVFLLFQNARSAFLEFIVAAALVLATDLLSRAPRLRAGFGKAQMALVLVASVFVLQGVGYVYSSLADSGALGEAAKTKYENQASGDVPLILGGRVESLVSTVAIADSPIVGHGSWAKDIYYARLLYARRQELGIKNYGGTAQVRDPLIPAHSYILQSWVEAGIAGALFWMLILYLAFTALYCLLRTRLEGVPILAVSTITLFWSVLFSPFGGEARFAAAYGVIVVLMIVQAGRLQRSPGR